MNGIQPDLRSLLNRIPRAPKSQEELLRWAGDLVSALDANAKDPFNTYTPDYAGTLTFSPTLSSILKVNTAESVGNCTIDARVGKPGPVWFIIKNDATSAKTITFGANLFSAGPLVGTLNKTAVVEFISDGSAYYEVARSLGL